MREVVYNPKTDVLGIKALPHRDDTFPNCPIKIQFLPDAIVEPTKIDGSLINWFFDNLQDMAEAGWEIIGEF